MVVGEDDADLSRREGDEALANAYDMQTGTVGCVGFNERGPRILKKTVLCGDPILLVAWNHKILV